MPAKSFVLYSSPVKILDGHVAIHAAGGGILYVRAETHQCGIDDALAKATPLDGETVLNSVEA